MGNERRPSFQFSISDLATFFGKSPVTIRNWERKGLVFFQREGQNRVVSTEEMRHIARNLYHAKRIDKDRLRLIESSITNLQILEKVNQVEYSNYRRARIGKEPASKRASKTAL
jgi:hypothetical protein